MKKPLLISTTLIALALSATSIYAQVVAGTSIVDKMKAAAHGFTLSSVLNPTDTGLQSSPIKGKKTGDILTAGEWNRVLELLGEGGNSPSSANYMQLNTPTSVTFTEGGKVPFTVVLGQKGSQITQNGGEITLKGGSSYRISADLRLTSPNSGVGYTIIDKSSGIGVGAYGTNYTGTLTGSWGGTAALALVSPTVDTTYFIKTSSLSGGPYSTSGAGHFTVEELGGSGGSSGSGGPALYKCTNAQSLDATNAPCYGASRNGGAGNNQYRVVSCSNTDASGTYTAGGLLNFGDFIANKWSFHINNSNIACADGSVLVMGIQGGGSGSSSTSSNLVYINPDNTDFAPLDCTPGVNYMINPIAFSAASASTYTDKKLAVLKSGNWKAKGTGFVRNRNITSKSSHTFRFNSILDNVTTKQFENTVDLGLYASSFSDDISVPAGKTAEINVSLRNNVVYGGTVTLWCTN